MVAARISGLLVDISLSAPQKCADIATDGFMDQLERRAARFCKVPDLRVWLARDFTVRAPVLHHDEGSVLYEIWRKDFKPSLVFHEGFAAINKDHLNERFVPLERGERGVP